MQKKPEIQKIYSLSPMQEGMLFHALADEESKAYFEQFSFSMSGKLDIEILEKSFNLILERYDILRTIFIYEKVKKPQQVVLKERKSKIYFEDISHLSEEDKTIYIEEFKRRDQEKGFNLMRDVLMRISVLQTTAEAYEIIWSNHHIIMDGWCRMVVMGDFFEIYQSLYSGIELKLGKVQPYSVYIDWLEKQDREETKNYWQDYLKDYERLASPLKIGNVRQDVSYRYGEYKAAIGHTLTSALTNLAVNSQATLSTVFQTIWGILLHRYNNVNDVVFGEVVSGRPSEISGIEKMVGLFINAIPVRVKGAPEQGFLELLRQVQQDAVASEKYSYFPLAEIQANTDLKQELIDHIVIFENYPMEEKISEQEVTPSSEIGDVEIFAQTNYDFSITVQATDNMTLVFKYNANIYDDEFIKKIGNHFIIAAQKITENPNIRIKDIEILTVEEKKQLLNDFNSTKTEFANSEVIRELFEAQVKKTPEKIAVVYENNKLTYAELNSRANILARLIRSKLDAENSTHSEGHIIAIMVERSVEMMVGIIGILKAGYAYLPIDPDYPNERIDYMLSDSGAAVVLTQKHLKDKLNFSGTVIHLDDSAVYTGDNTNIGIEVKPDDLAYVIYTSGTTGTPKGAMIENHSVVNLVNGLAERIYENCDTDLNIALLAPYVFDASIKQIFPCLLLGHTLFIVPEETRLDGQELLTYYNTNRVDLSDGTPAHFRLLADSIEGKEKALSVKTFVIGGEALTAKLVKEFIGRFEDYYPTIINVYGPTECCDVTTTFSVNTSEIEGAVGIIPLGFPIANTSVYILGRNLELLPVGVAGELHIGGKGLGRGYLNSSELTAQKYIQNPYQNGERMYKTGDLARWLPNGSIQFIGRADSQVKIRGHRIELGEIENQLLKQGSIKEVVVVVKEDASANKYLCAYFVSPVELTAQEIRWYLAQVLPDYMIPSHYVALTEMPLTRNGKVDLRALPEPDGSINTGFEYLAPRNELEEKLVAIWKDVLETDKVGVNDNFFSIGGHSIKALQLVSLLKKQQILIKVADIYTHSTVKELAHLIASKHVDLDIQSIKVNTQSTQRDHLKVLDQIVENDDLYSWEELNCFYRPLAILFDSFTPGYYDLFLFYVSYYNIYAADGWFDNPFTQEEVVHLAFFDFYKNVLEEKLGIAIDINYVSNEEEMHQTIKQIIDSGNGVLVPSNIKSLYYYPKYMEEDHIHYFVVRGYDTQKRLYHVLDNMHIDGGTSTIYENFVVEAPKLFEMMQAYFNTYWPGTGKPYFWSLKEKNPGSRSKVTCYNALFDHYEHLEKLNAKLTEIKYIESETIKEIESYGNPDRCGNILYLINFKAVYYDTLFKFLSDSGLDETLLNELIEIKERLVNMWRDIKVSLLGKVAEEDYDFTQMKQQIEENIKVEKLFREKFIQNVFNLNLRDVLERQNQGNLKNILIEENINKALITNEGDTYRMFLRPGKRYEMWTGKDSAPKLFVCPSAKSDFVFSAKVDVVHGTNNRINQNFRVANEMNLSYQDGIVLKFANNTKLLFGILAGGVVKLFFPENGNDNTLWDKRYDDSTLGIYLKVEKINDLFVFYNRFNSNEQWERLYSIKTQETVESIGVFSRTWAPIVHETTFTDIQYNIYE